MKSNNLKVTFPESKNNVDQDEEYLILTNPHSQKIRFHEYEKIYKIPGLYEEVFQKRLKCQSPDVISDLLFENIESEHDNPDSLRILDFGAGNGMVAEKLKKEDPEVIVGIDILEEAREAAFRDRDHVYDEYIVTDLGNPQDQLMDKLEDYNLNSLISVAALGYDHIPPKGFINAFNLIEDGGWIAFNIRDKFLENQDDSGFKNTIDWMSDSFIKIIDEKTYRHRYSINGNELKYVAIVGKKIKDIPLKQNLN